MTDFLRAFVVVLIGLVVLVGVAMYPVFQRGVSARAEPSWAEELLTRAARRLATPAAARAMRNPVEPTREVLDDALAHFADHCASCHANDGSGETSMGRGFYPRAPDMRARPTQSMSDGELFAIIENGVRLTGMPAWGDGTPDGARASWGLVHFIRRLSTLSAEDIDRMAALNPRSADQFREEEAARRFLAGEDVQR